jgi:dynein heavy chain
MATALPASETAETLGEEGEVRTFGRKLMSSRPTTAIINEADDKLPYPELFDRTERTFAATFAKFGDLSYFTPVQRIGIYMDYSQRLQRRHLTDLIAYLKTAKHSIKPLDEDQARTEAGQREYLGHCLFHGSMPLEDAPKSQLGFDEQKQQRKDQREAMKREFDFPLLSVEDQGQFQYNQVWSGQLMRQVEISTHRFLRYIESPDSIRNEEVAKFRKEWMQKALDLIPETLLTQYSTLVKEVFQEVF